LNAFAAFTRDHKRYPSSASALFVFIVRSLCTPLFLFFWHGNLPFSAYIQETHGIALRCRVILVISTRSRISNNNKINKKFTPKYPFPAGLHNSERLQHIIPASFQTTAARVHFFLLILEESWVNTGKAGAGAI
jgi:hypothetical protein